MNAFLSSKFRKRAVSALILAPLVLWMIFAGGLPFLFLVLFCAAVALYEWLQLSLKTAHKIPFIVAGFVYLGISFWACYLLRIDHSPWIALLFMGMVWASDIGAYLAGKIFKGPRMAVTISPNKTWSGMGGAMLSPAILGVIYAFAISDYDHIALPFAAGLVLGGVGQAGDLLISWFKRHVGVKDTGALIPGHGGLLDRIDAMLLAAPVFLWVVKKFPYVFAS